MLNIKVENSKTHVDGAGTKDDLIIECWFAMHACVKTLRDQLGKGDNFIKGVFEIALTHTEGEQDD